MSGLRIYHLGISNLIKPRVLAMLWLITCVFCLFGVNADNDVKETSQHGIRNLISNPEAFVEQYVPEFLGLDRSLIGRAAGDTESLSNNVPQQTNIQPGDSQFYSFSKASLGSAKSKPPKGLPSAFEECPDDPDVQMIKQRELRKRQSGSTLFLSLNTCDQPSPKKSSTSGPPNQLQLFVSTSASNKKPDASKHDYSVTVDEGYGSINFTASNDVYIGVTAPSNSAFSGIYDYEITASIDDYFAKSDSSTASRYIDSDKQTSLIYTNNTTSCNSTQNTFKSWDIPPPFSLFVAKQSDPAIQGLQRSMCGLKNHALIQQGSNIDISMTLTGGGQPKQQFYVKTLNASTSYIAIVALQGTNGNLSSSGSRKVNGGGFVWGATNFTTKSSPNCAVVYGMDFCSEIAYAVPANSTDAADLPGLRATYDSFASSLYQNFSRSLSLIPCNTTASAQYSLAVNCTDCANAYKNWLCAVTIPRCADFSDEASYLQPRAVGLNFIDKDYGNQFDGDSALSPSNKSFTIFNSSRNPMIDTVIKPGPYKELLPCEDLCYGLVRSCPAALGFACPLDRHGLNYTYGKLRSDGRDQYTCNFPGMDLSVAASLRTSMTLAMFMMTATVLWTLLT